MIDDVGRNRQPESNDRRFRNWRIVVSAWVLVLIFVMLLAAVDATACRRGGSRPDGHFAGIVIPQHDPCGGPGIPSAAGLDGCESAPSGGDRFDYW